MPDYVSCNINQLTDEQLIAALLTKDEEGNFAIRTTFVDACEEDAIDCATNMLPIGTQLRKCIGVDPVCGKPALRLANTKAAQLNALEDYANDAAAALGGVPVGGLYYDTTNDTIVARMA